MVAGTRKVSGNTKASEGSPPKAPATNKRKRPNKQMPTSITAIAPEVQVSPALELAKSSYVLSDGEDENGDGDGDGDGNEEDEEDDTPVRAPVPMAKPPPRKKIQSSARVVTVVIPPWVPLQMKIDLLSLHNAKSTPTTKVETLACLRYYVRVIMMQKRNITVADRIDFAVCFGVSEDDATAYETGINCGDGEKP